MAHLPATQAKSSTPASKLERQIRKRLMKGHSPPEVAKAMVPDDHPDKDKLRKEIRRRGHLIVARDQDVQAAIYAETMGIGAAALPATMSGLAKMAARGRSPQAKLLMEATGFFTPHSRQDHNHSGEIEIKMTGIPRPTHQVEEPVEAQAYEDAEVVD